MAYSSYFICEKTGTTYNAYFYENDGVRDKYRDTGVYNISLSRRMSDGQITMLQASGSYWGSVTPSSYPASITLLANYGDGPGSVVYTLTLGGLKTVKAETGGSVTNAATSAVTKSGAAVSSAATASAGFEFLGWYSGAGNNLDAASCTTLETENATLSETMGQQDVTYVAKFKDLRHTLTVNPALETDGTVTVFVGDSAENLSEISLDENDQYVVLEGQYVRVVAEAVVARVCNGWGATGILPSIDSTYTFEMPVGDVELTAIFADKPKYTIEWRVGDGSFPYDTPPNTATVAGCSLAFDGYETTDPPIDTDPDKWYEGLHTVTASSVTGWEIIAWVIINADTGVEAYRSDTKPLDASFEFTLGFNAIIQCDFYRVPVTVNAAVHTASAKSGVYAEVSFGEEQGTDISVHYGDTVSFTATVGSYSFGGWFDADGVLLSDDPTYDVALYADTTVYLKVKGTVTLTATNAANASGTVAVDGGTAGATATKEVLLGETCTILATPASLSSFECWFDSSDTFEEPVAGYDAEQLITVTDHVALSSYIVLTSSLVTRYLAVLIFDNSTGLADGTLGTVSADLGLYGTELTKSEWETATGCTAPIGSDSSPNHKYYSFIGTRASVITATAADAEAAPFLSWYRNTMTGTAPNLEILTYSEPIGSANPITSVSTTGYIIKAFFGAPSSVNVSCGYCTGSDLSLGGFEMTPETDDRTTSTGSKSDIYTQGESVTFVADIANGYVFAGWFSNSDGSAGHLVSSLSTYTVTVQTSFSLFAKFVVDDSAVYMWEGGTTNKRVEWRSKRYVATKPFNPSAARVYADSYPSISPVTLNLYMESSPSSPSLTTPTVSVNARKQDSFRLPMARPEKYLEIEILSSDDVTEAVVSTSMGGLAQ